MNATIQELIPPDAASWSTAAWLGAAIGALALLVLNPHARRLWLALRLHHRRCSRFHRALVAPIFTGEPALMTHGQPEEARRR